MSLKGIERKNKQSSKLVEEGNNKDQSRKQRAKEDGSMKLILFFEKDS